MRSTTFFVFAFAAVFQVSTAIPLIAPPCGAQLPAIPTIPLTPSTGVANNLADTLSLLTVSSLLADKLPYNQYCGIPLPGPYLTEPYLPGPYLTEPYLPGPYLPGPYLPGPYLPGCGCWEYPYIY